MVKISVIIPVYNVEEYINECLDSIINQSFKDIEIICVDDGSTDNSLNILKEFQNKDSRIKIITQENKGIGASRNAGLSYACGEYVYFIDSDDYLEANAFEELISIAKDKEVDFIIFKISNFYNESNELVEDVDDYYNMTRLKDRVGDTTFKYSDIKQIALKLCVCSPGNFFKHELISDLRFPEGLLFEDNVFFTEALFKAKSIYFYDEFLYHRRVRIESTSNSLTVRYLDIIEIDDLMLDLCMEYGHKRHKKQLYYRIFHDTYQIFKNADESQKELFFEKIRHEYLKHKEKWEKDDFFRERLKPEYKHMFNCAIKSKDAKKYESCVDNYQNDSMIKKLRNKLL